jgi:hypothetical protein
MVWLWHPLAGKPWPTQVRYLEPENPGRIVVRPGEWLSSRQAMSTQDPSEEKPTDTTELEQFTVNDGALTVVVDPDNVLGAWVETDTTVEVYR